MRWGKEGRGGESIREVKEGGWVDESEGRKE